MLVPSIDDLGLTLHCQICGTQRQCIGTLPQASITVRHMSKFGAFFPNRYGATNRHILKTPLGIIGSMNAQGCLFRKELWALGQESS